MVRKERQISIKEHIKLIMADVSVCVKMGDIKPKVRQIRLKVRHIILELRHIILGLSHIILELRNIKHVRVVGDIRLKVEHIKAIHKFKVILQVHLPRPHWYDLLIFKILEITFKPIKVGIVNIKLKVVHIMVKHIKLKVR